MTRHAYHYEDTPEATEFKRLYNKLQFAHNRDGLKIFLVTSATVGEGKSTVAAFLAAARAYNNAAEILLVDCDLRRPMVHKLFDLPLENGVVDVLAHDKDIRTVLKASVLPNLKVITAGAAKQSPAILLSSARLHEMFEQLRFHFGIVLIDAPPLLPVSDAQLLGNEADGIVFVFKAGETPKRVVQRAAELLDDNRRKLVGAVINNMKGAMPYYYDYRYYNYKYDPKW
jgi:capsular exopolysaccharide synthesis family protein